MKKVEKIQRALRRLEQFRRWFRTIPEENIDLNDFLTTPDHQVWYDYCYKTTSVRRQDLTSCGTTGCVAGWCRAWLSLQGKPFNTIESELGVDLLTGSRKLEGTFSPRRNRRQSQRVEALSRLTQLRTALTQELSYVSEWPREHAVTK